MRTDDLPLSRTTLDRDTTTRADPRALRAALADPRGRILHVDSGRVLVDPAADRLVLTAVGAGERAPAPGIRYYLGQDGDGPLVAEVASSGGSVGTRDDDDDDGDQAVARAGRWLSLRDVGSLLSARDAGAATAAIALHNWHLTHTRCPRCGARTTLTQGGWVQRCPEDGSEHYPRTDPAVIMTIVDDADRLLLAHNALWPATRYSVPAGYVEPGESLEAAVRREVLEETAVVVGDVAYEGSQPWPFPASLMVGFRGRALTTEPVPDGRELIAAEFVDRGGLRDRVHRGELTLPTATSIAHSLIRDWFGDDLPVVRSPAEGDVGRP
ncbi:NAD(+) diphosphatase [Pseudactinotalea sp. HY158]|uniref:NAD(+) diphosphatase n=1 Tax=Pseudactinotalea sp. HY158 TaxID=2654547 RepID=UPI001E3FDFD3|nr:NAD(+) diphosphatase [Pseudactinotalea sp. HY158]